MYRRRLSIIVILTVLAISCLVAMGATTSMITVTSRSSDQHPVIVSGVRLQDIEERQVQGSVDDVVQKFIASVMSGNQSLLSSLYGDGVVGVTLSDDSAQRPDVLKPAMAMLHGRYAFIVIEGSKGNEIRYMPLILKSDSEDKWIILAQVPENNPALSFLSSLVSLHKNVVSTYDISFEGVATSQGGTKTRVFVADGNEQEPHPITFHYDTASELEIEAVEDHCKRLFDCVERLDTNGVLALICESERDDKVRSHPGVESTASEYISRSIALSQEKLRLGLPAISKGIRYGDYLICQLAWPQEKISWITLKQHANGMCISNDLNSGGDLFYSFIRGKQGVSIQAAPAYLP